MKNIIVGTAGHIDHGKTELIKALTGVDTDRLKEEKERGITIDIGFANLKYGDDLLVGFIDVPGHERFVKNMLAGAAGVDFVLLVVAADESVKPQTVEHFDICKLLGVKSGIVVMTKIDCADEDLIRLAEMEIGDLLKDSFMERAPIVHTSARTGEGIKELKELIRSMAISIEQKSEEGLTRLPIDRSFSIKGFGTVITGTLVSGKVRMGEELELLPAEKRCRVRGIEVHGESRDAACAGQRTALNLSNIAYLDVMRGDTLSTPGALKPSMIIDANVILLKSARPLKDLVKVRFHYGTSEIMARLKLLESSVLSPGCSMYAQLRMEKPIVVLPGDRFIIRFYSPSITIGGGVILDNSPKKHRTGDREVLRQLSMLESGNDHDKLHLILTLFGEGGASFDDLGRRTGMEKKKIARIMKDLIDEKKAVSIPGEQELFITQHMFDGLKERVVGELKKYHMNNPLMTGMAKESLKTKIGRSLDQGIFDALLKTLCSEGTVRIQAGMVAYKEHTIRLSPDELEIMRYIENEFKRAGLDSPEPSRVLNTASYQKNDVSKIFKLLLREGLLVQVKEDRVYHKQSIDDLMEKLGRYAGKKSIIDIASFKELAGITRKNAIPLLEYFDSIKVTKRMGNERLILVEKINKD